jgi:hypothetical protein
VPTPIQNSPRNAPSSSSSGSTTGTKNTSTNSHSTCVRGGARRNEFHRFCNSFTLSLTRTGTCAICHPLLLAPSDHTCCHLLFRLMSSTIESLP